MMMIMWWSLWDMQSHSWWLQTCLNCEGAWWQWLRWEIMRNVNKLMTSDLSPLWRGSSPSTSSTCGSWSAGSIMILMAMVNDHWSSTTSRILQLTWKSLSSVGKGTWLTYYLPRFEGGLFMKHEHERASSTCAYILIRASWSLSAEFAQELILWS